jgi:hypothetical protein
MKRKGREEMRWKRMERTGTGAERGGRIEYMHVRASKSTPSHVKILDLPLARRAKILQSCSCGMAIKSQPLD